MRAAALLACIAMTAAAISDEQGEDKVGGVTKVLKILADMKTQLEKEAENDDEVMDAMVCWCETNDKGKTKAIADNTQSVDRLSAAIEEYTASAAQLKDDIAQTKKDIEANAAELAEATALREKDAAEFADNEASQTASVSGLTNAVKALGSKLALPQRSLLQVSQALRGHLTLGFTDAKLRELGLTPAQRREIKLFLQTKAGSKESSPASNEVLGVLKQMKESFESSLKESQTEESDAKKSYGNLKAAKDKEIGAANEQVEMKTAQLAEAVERLAQSKADLKETRATLEADTAFLADLKERCSNMNAEFAQRTQTRALEIKAVGEAYNILTSDDARDQLRSVRFVQISSTKSRAALQTNMMRVRSRASRIVLAAAVHLGSPRLATIAVDLRSSSDVFVKVKEAIDKMLTQLKQENKDEIKHRDWCIDELNQNDRQTDDAYDHKKELETTSEDLQLFLENVGSEIAAAEAAIKEAHVQMKSASEDREKENKEFQATVLDQRATQALLTKALEKLQAFYNKKGALVQVHEVADTEHHAKTGQAPPPGFGGSYQKSQGSTGVIMMIQGIIKESKTVEAQAVAAEQEATTAYEQFITDSSASVQTLQEGIAEKKVGEARSAQESARTGADMKAQLKEIERLSEYAQELHLSCDFTIKNFEVRQASRAKEMEALGQAKAVLSGADLR